MKISHRFLTFTRFNLIAAPIYMVMHLSGHNPASKQAFLQWARKKARDQLALSKSGDAVLCKCAQSPPAESRRNILPADPART